MIKLILTLLSGLCWTWVYVDAVRLGFAQRTYAIPLFALALNLAWELIYAVVELGKITSMQTISVQGVINAIWFAFDLAIVFTYLKFGRRAWPSTATWTFAVWSILVFATGFAVQSLFLYEFGTAAPGYSAFLQNLLMSVLFIALFVNRRGPAGQSLRIAINKGVGTLAPTVLFGAMNHSPFILGVGGLCAVFDALYVVMLARPARTVTLLGLDA